MYDIFKTLSAWLRGPADETSPLPHPLPTHTTDLSSLSQLYIPVSRHRLLELLNNVALWPQCPAFVGLKQIQRCTVNSDTRLALSLAR